jgi:capsid protein
MMTQTFVSRFVQPIWERFVDLAILSGQIKVPPHIRRDSVAQASFRGPKMPWIDPLKEANGIRVLARSGVQSITQTIAERGGRLQDVYEEIARERQLAEDLGIKFDSDIVNDRSTGASAAKEEDENEEAPQRNPRRRLARMRLVSTGDNH